ncbi:hypothetical protein PoB_000018900 [Plakobranchus ocellatus]|uniref:Uncharacterized protein n=1 Tax=Plakobranchus ocellatus TaxID=259542 RepID=A0AAV3XUR8_9GAST|nr:hypothetical protein PoB_000018900 [Plakobranchus ocellatus]
MKTLCIVEKIPEKQWPVSKLRASTPKDKAIPISLSMSPVRMPSWDNDDLGLQLVESVEVNTSEILVPSLMEPSGLQEQEVQEDLIGQVR